MAGICFFLAVVVVAGAPSSSLLCVSDGFNVGIVVVYCLIVCAAMYDFLL